MAQFENSLNKFEQKAMRQVDQVRRAAVLELFSLVIDGTPFDEGFLRGGWQTSLNSPATGGILRADPTGAAAKLQVLSNLGDLNSVIYFVNAMPYAYRIEFDAWSAQAPNGMVRPEVVKWKTIVANKAKEFLD